jgi:UDP-N-acetylmuramate dehydrogenase
LCFINARSKILPNNKEAIEESIIENAPLARFTTLGIGGAAKFFIEVTSSQSLASSVEWARSRDLPLFVLGGGSNVVIADAGFAGLVIRLSIGGIEARLENRQAIIKAGAGIEWDSFVASCVENDWAGVECLSGIPGRVGATPIQNVGAYGQEVSETILAVEAFDTQTNALVELNAEECEFAYRASRFKVKDRQRFIITGVTYQLTVHGKPAIRYADLQKYFAEQIISNPSLKEVRQAVIAIRRRKAMVLDAYDSDSRSVGSFFVNPLVTLEEFENVKQQAGKIIPDIDKIPVFAAANQHLKLSAAWLIEQSGTPRGTVYGNVGTSTKHSLAIINRGGGTAREVLELCEIIKARVLDVFGVALTPEPVFVGFER